MKLIGYTEHQNPIVEIDRVEYAELQRLSIAVEGKPLFEYFNPDNGRMEFDFTKTFGVIRAFYEANFKINELQRLIDLIKESINK